MGDQNKINVTLDIGQDHMTNSSSVSNVESSPANELSASFGKLDKAIRINHSHNHFDYFELQQVEIKGVKKIKSSKESSSSDFSIGGDGSLFEDWVSVETIPAKLIEANPETVLLECLIDSVNKEFQLRKFKRNLLEGRIPIAQNVFILIKIFERPGKHVIEFHNAKGLGYETYFEVDDSDIDEIETGGFIR